MLPINTGPEQEDCVTANLQGFNSGCQLTVSSLTRCEGRKFKRPPTVKTLFYKRDLLTDVTFTTIFRLSTLNKTTYEIASNWPTYKTL